ncbi:hypothetical protein AJ80_07113 [Polytolypa hystricis UAMH7299]|uniref:Homeobox domain-containing protein n=1 Tax=Polytolypa hystricis (strain UAMH7299) TaxID=1447883 RepID=A0A2B7XI82_POLH7|nr:hypothetical protein AJ80_07113 [Polytolypa hystricis UAMH7299]
MSDVMAPISMHQAVTGWHHQQLESRQSLTQPRSCGSFSGIAKPRGFGELEEQDQKPDVLKLKEMYAAPSSSVIKEEPTSNGEQNLPSNTQIEANHETLDLSKVKHPESDSADSVPTTQSESDRSSPGTHLTAISTDGDHVDANGEIDCENEVDMGEPMQDQQRQLEEPAKTAAEKRAEKRKMKRFRLTHNQTRFLMSEFTRQAHPDAAHRERLSREIPGLSPRQVQVWFQNRRAKLKRLTSDDRERMLKSRALPDDFDMSQALHSPYGNRSHPSSTPLPSPGGAYFPSHTDSDILTPLVLDPMKRPGEDEYVTSPLSANSTYGGYFASPTNAPPGSEADVLSPTATAHDRTALYTSVPHPPTSAPRHMNMFSRSSSFSNAYSQTHPQIPRLQLHDRAVRSRAGSLNSPLRASISYTTATLDYGVADAPIGLNVGYNGHSFDNPTSQAGGEKTEPYSIANHSGLPVYETKSSLRLRTNPTSLPADLQIKPDYKDTPAALQSAPLPVTQEDHLSPLSPHFTPNPFGLTYTQQNSSSMSLPASFFPYNGNQKMHEEFPGSYDNGVGIHNSLDALRGRTFTTGSYDFGSNK